ncbi:MAG: class I SAM-dependent methyltransferase, partial [Anaerolineae bacterium]|nr:class I SAM-dependent methyltransferase [Anaerolineae bacterium]
GTYYLEINCAMPSVDENKQWWNDGYVWKQGGDEWSRAWGGVDMQWHAAVLPRIHSFVPAGRILEIAPGFGRWTQYLTGLCDHLIAVDLSENAIEHCRQRFAGDTNIDFFVNDGSSLEMVPDASIDFVFSFDSLVHASADVLRAYLLQIARKLTRDGVAFLHHSNLGEYTRYFSAVEKIPPRGQPLLKKVGLEYRTHWRDPGMTAGRLREFAQEAGLICISQELFGWGGSRRLIDAISMVTLPESKWTRPLRLLRNEDFVRDISVIARLAPLYSADSFPASAE